MDWEAKSPLRALLLPLSGLYAAGWLGYLGIYALGLKRAARPGVPVVCIGNLVSGGAGKTPTTRFVLSRLRAMGREVVLSVNGYGSPRAGGAHWAPPGELDASEWGDEAALLRLGAPDVPMVVGRDRVLAARFVAEKTPRAVMLMDDGFQHLRLHLRHGLVLDPEGLTNRWCLPAGPYREPRRIGLRRASATAPGTFEHVRRALVGLDALPSEFGLLCAVARPERLLADLAAQGHKPATRLVLPDHDPLTAGNLLAPFAADLPILVTAKDWVKLRARPDAGSRTWHVVDV